MLFNSLEFMIFFPVVAGLYFFCVYFVKKNWINQLLLLAASLFFYACWNPSYLFLILLSVLVTWLSGIFMEKYNGKKKIILFLSLFINLGILFFFKYFNFFTDTIKFFLPDFSFGSGFDVLLPVGISFYTFQALGYSIDVYKGTVKAERNFFSYALFVTFFPQLVAGPIERTENLLPQFKVNHEFDYNRVTDGLKLAAWGMFKKIVVADRLSVYVNTVYENVHQFSDSALLLATFFFAFQIFCDFSGYSDIAIGVSKVLGFNLMKNFKRPYFAKSIAEFWHRWHISLSTWFKDYVYIPLGGNRVSVPRHCMNLFLTFAVSGLWHGASWHFAAWGALHGLYQIAGRFTKPFTSKLRNDVFIFKLIKTLFTFSLVCIAWVFFRASTMGDALYVVSHILTAPLEIFKDMAGILNHSVSFGEGVFGKYTLGMVKSDFLILWVLTFCIILIDLITRNKDGCEIVRSFPLVVRWVLYYLLIITILGVVVYSLPSSQFIYFQF